jgi:hypothetical protein
MIYNLKLMIYNLKAWFLNKLSITLIICYYWIIEFTEIYEPRLKFELNFTNPLYCETCIKLILNEEEFLK